MNLFHTFAAHCITQEGEIIKNLNKGEFYKYLGINQSNHIQHSIIMENLEKQFYLRIKSLLESKLNDNNLIKAVNTYAVPLLTYSFGVIKWSKTNLQNINIKTSVLFAKFSKHHPKSAIERFNLPRENGGRDFSNLEIINQIASLKNYFLNRARDNTFFNAIQCNAIQDHVINTRNYKKHICGLQSIIDKCRICGTEGETIEYIISSCTVLAQSEYKKRHDIFAKIIHMNLAVKFNLLKNNNHIIVIHPKVVGK
jgi:hypothetical protein